MNLRRTFLATCVRDTFAIGIECDSAFSLLNTWHERSVFWYLVSFHTKFCRVKLWLLCCLFWSLLQMGLQRHQERPGMAGLQAFWFFYPPGSWPVRYNTDGYFWMFLIVSGYSYFCLIFFKNYLFYYCWKGVWWLQSLWWGIGLGILLFVWRSFIPSSGDELKERGGYSCWNTRPHKGVLLLLYYLTRCNAIYISS